MKKYNLATLTDYQKKSLCKRPAIDTTKVEEIVRPILQHIKASGLEAVITYAKKYDNIADDEISIDVERIKKAKKLVNPELVDAIKVAKNNIEKFHDRQNRSNMRQKLLKEFDAAKLSERLKTLGYISPVVVLRYFQPC